MNRQGIIYFALGVLAITVLFLGGCAGQDTITVAVPQGATSTSAPLSPQLPLSVMPPLASTTTAIKPDQPPITIPKPSLLPTSTARSTSQLTWFLAA
jgi:hypothetical protein